jgi:membrane associated rhomboid family serine protease
VWFPLWNNRVPAEAVAYSYKRVVLDYEAWRLLTSAFSHLDIFHLVFNVTSMWACRLAEWELGSWRFAMQSLALIIASKLVSLSIYHVLYQRFSIRRWAAGYVALAGSGRD